MDNCDLKVSSVNVTIIGAGVSGLCAAHHLLKTDPNLSVVVLEAKARAGGRTLGVELEGSNGKELFDLGGQWVGTCQPHVMELLEELSLDIYPQFITGKKVMQLGSSRVRTYDSTIPSLSWLALVDLFLFMSKMERMRRLVPVNDPSLCPYASEWDSMTYEQALQKFMWTKEARQAIEATGRCMFGVEPRDMSLLYFLYYAQAAGGLEKLISSEPGMGNEYKIKGGAFQIGERLVKSIGEDKIFCNHAVIDITQEEHRVLVKTNTGKTFASDRVILAIPPHQAAKIEYFPPLPVDKLYVLGRMPVGHLTKVVVTYKQAFWRDAGYSGEVVSNGGECRVGRLLSGPICIGFDNSSSRGTPALVVFIGGDQQRQYAQIQAIDRRKAVLQSLSELFGPPALECLDYAEKNWSEEAYNGGCPVSVATPGVISAIAPGLRHPFERLHFAGTESATVWCGFISGAVQAGYRAANEVLYNIRPSSVSAKDLEATFYNVCNNQSQKRRKRMFRIVASLAGLIVTSIVFRKRLVAIATNAQTKYF